MQGGVRARPRVLDTFGEGVERGLDPFQPAFRRLDRRLPLGGAVLGDGLPSGGGFIFAIGDRNGCGGSSMTDSHHAKNR